MWAVELGFPPLLNRSVFSLDGWLLGIPDILDDEAGTVLEYDGDEHRDINHHTADNAREELFEDHGLVACRAGRVDLGPHRRQTLHRMRRAGRADSPATGNFERWTLKPRA